MEHLNKRGLLVEDTTIVQKPEASRKTDLHIPEIQ